MTKHYTAKEIANFGSERDIEKEYTDKKVKLVEQITGKKILVKYNINSQYNSASRSSKNEYDITLNGDIPIRTGVDHELSHCREGSLENKFWKPYTAIVRTWIQKENHTRGVYMSASSEHMIENVCHTAMNIIEDVRIESIDGYRFLGRQKSYDKLCIDEGNSWKENNEEADIKTIEGYVLAERFHRGDLIPDQYKTETHRVYEESKLQTIAGIHKVFSDWLNGSLGEQIRNNINDMEEIAKQRNQCTKDSQEAFNKLDHIQNEICTRESNQAYNNDPIPVDELQQNSKRLEDLKKELSDVSESYDQYQEQKNSLVELFSAISESVIKKQMDKKGSQYNSNYYPRTVTSKQMISMIEKIEKTSTSKEKNNNKKALDKEREQLGNGASAPDLSKGFDMLKPNPSAINGYSGEDPVKVYDEVVSEIRKIANTLKQKRKSSISDEGSDIDIELMLEAVKKGSNDFYINEEKTNGTSILISVDCSGSMKDYNRLIIARNLCATMFRSVDSLPSIDMKVLLYGGADSSYCRTGMLEINNEKDCAKIGIDSSRPLTPTNDALIYSAHLMNKMKGKKKLLLFLTDGEPANYNRTSLETLCEQAQKSYQKIKKDYPNMVIKPIMIGTNGSNSNPITIIFGKDALFLEIEKLSDFIKNEFKKEISKSF